MATDKQPDAEVAQLLSSLLDQVEFEADGCLVTGLEFHLHRRRADSDDSSSSSSSGGLGAGCSDDSAHGATDEEEGDEEEIASQQPAGLGRGRGRKRPQADGSEHRPPRRNPLGDLEGVIGPVERLTLSVPAEVAMRQCATVSSVLGALVVAQSEPDLNPLDINSVLFLSDRQPLGQVLDVFGPVSRPFYSVLLPSPEVVAELGVAVGQPLLFADEDSLRHFILPARLAATQPRPSDASWLGDQEPPAECLDYSDDEAERLAKRQAKRRGPDGETAGEELEAASVAAPTASAAQGQQQRRKPNWKKQQLQSPAAAAQAQQRQPPHHQPYRFPPQQQLPHQHQPPRRFLPPNPSQLRYPPQHHPSFQHPSQQHPPYQQSPQQHPSQHHPPFQHPPFQRPPQQHPPYQQSPQQHPPYQQPPYQHPHQHHPPQQHQPYQYPPQQHPPQQPYSYQPAHPHQRQQQFSAHQEVRGGFPPRPFPGMSATGDGGGAGGQCDVTNDGGIINERATAGNADRSAGSTSWPPPVHQRRAL
ncbi:hypothetical protein BOX15_Mlig005199g1 [Macrostomum lignano]|uniref:H/ACA ribonucleoprotein complex non-core subunit NAF1 n=1 Tax=Macrostomum lignano TaxID=282301 RepID=A0A267FD20_9PLAT|nr:hypothetical protein BOX15_Mlig005199g1 [Macrostomum lignano]